MTTQFVVQVSEVFVVKLSTNFCHTIWAVVQVRIPVVGQYILSYHRAVVQLGWMPT